MKFFFFTIQKQLLFKVTTEMKGSSSQFKTKILQEEISGKMVYYCPRGESMLFTAACIDCLYWKLGQKNAAAKSYFRIIMFTSHIHWAVSQNFNFFSKKKRW